MPLCPLGYDWRLTVTQEQVTYYQTPHLREFAKDRFPVWVWLGSVDEQFYGFPVHGEAATKAAQENMTRVVTPETRTFEPDLKAQSTLTAFLERYIPRSVGPVLYSKTCLYDLPPDRNFILDTLPDYPQIIVAVGAAHAYKFAGLLGRILSQLALDGTTSYAVDSFASTRPALTDPGYPLEFLI